MMSNAQIYLAMISNVVSKCTFFAEEKIAEDAIWSASSVIFSLKIQTILKKKQVRGANFRE